MKPTGFIHLEGRAIRAAIIDVVEEAGDTADTASASTILTLRQGYRIQTTLSQAEVLDLIDQATAATA